MLFIPKEIVSHILNYSDWGSVYNLKCVCKTINELDINFNIVKRRLVENVNKILYKSFGESITEFNNILEQLGGVISGSTILESLLSVEWDNSDIDIYIPHNKSLFSPLEKFIYGVPNCKYLSRESSSRYSGFKPRHYEIVWLRTYEIEGKKIQVIHVNVNANTKFDIEFNIKPDLINFINKSFDFSIVKNAYYIKDNKPIVYIQDIKRIKNKTFKFRYTCNPYDSINRANKYINRGFAMINKITLERLMRRYDIIDYELKVYILGKYYICIPGQNRWYEFHKKKISTLIHLPCQNNCPFKFFNSNCNHAHIKLKVRKGTYINSTLIILSHPV